MICAEQPNVKESGRYTVGQAAKALGIHRNTLLRYSNGGYIRFSIGENTARKYYEGKDILRFWKHYM